MPLKVQCFARTSSLLLRYLASTARQRAVEKSLMTTLSHSVRLCTKALMLRGSLMEDYGFPPSVLRCFPRRSVTDPTDSDAARKASAFRLANVQRNKSTNQN